MSLTAFLAEALEELLGRYVEIKQLHSLSPAFPNAFHFLPYASI